MSTLDRPLPDITLAVVGRPFPNRDGGNRGFEILICRRGEPIELRPEPRNRYDPRAIAVYSARGVQIGYLSAERAGRIGAIIRSGHDVRAVFQEETGFGAWIRVGFTGRDPKIPRSASSLPVEPPGEGWFPDDIWPDEFDTGGMDDT